MTPTHCRTDTSASWKRALELKAFTTLGHRLAVDLEEETGKRWRVEFDPVQAFRVTAEECAASIYASLPRDGALFIVNDSPWRGELGDSEPLRKAHHFVVCCYDEVIEVLAWKAAIRALEAENDRRSTATRG